MKEINVFTTTRIFNAPRQLVWDAWTKQEHLSKWFTPPGLGAGKSELDFRPGGTYHYSMVTPDGQTMWGLWTFKEIDPIDSMTVITAFSDEARGVIPAPIAKNWPLRTLSVTNFEDMGDKTKLTLNWQPYEATDAEIEMFNNSHDSMNQGWGGTMKQLDDYLASIQ
ncbi:MAG TPA: SRPBCC domain-containing protein [Candidatus Kapabacteria bacterium]|nr:SRPBCC domain-containing protein [Candidatus Kapabacteria bacterium]